MMKDRLTKLLKAKQEQRDTLNASMINADAKEERAAIGETLTALGKEIAELEAMLADVDEPADGGDEGRSATASGATRGLNVLATQQQRAATTEDDTSSVEYRKAFQKFMETGSMEYRTDATTHTSDANISTVIPQNLVDKILEKFEDLGTIYNLVTHTAYPVGQQIPVDGVKPTATWVGRNTTTPASSTTGEGNSSDAQAKTLGAAITFSHFKLRCEVRITEEVGDMTLAAFEAMFVKQVGEAMIRAKEFAIVEGDGYGMPTGILNETPETGKAITIAEGTALSYDKLCECEAAIEAQYEGRAKWCMTKRTFMSFVGMTDSNGQPIARINYGLNGKPERYLLGREVVIYVPQAGSVLKDFAASVDADTVVAFIFAFDDYAFNTNYNLGISHAKDWDNEDHKTKAVEACDGKVIDKGSLVTLTIDAA